jgi:hypothetical protein
MSLFPCLNNVIKSKHPWTVVLVPQINSAERLRLMAGMPSGSVCAGRTWRTPSGEKITFAVPDNAIPEGVFDLVLCGWGHRPTPPEVLQTKAWRDAACCRRPS